MPQLSTLRYDILQTEQRLRELEQKEGKTSDSYYAEQKKLLRLWALMRMMHKKEEFISELLSTKDG
jgi:hypothetical protein